MAVTGTVASVISLTKTVVSELINASSPHSISTSFSFTDGVAALMVNRTWSNQSSLAASANENVDLAGTLVDEFGTTLTFARLKVIYVKNTSALASIKVQPGASTGFVSAFADDVNIAPGGILLLVAPDATGYVTAAGSTDLMNVTNLDGVNAATYDIFIAGCAT